MRFKNLEKFRAGGTTSRMKLAIPVPRTPEGRAYRYSPNETAFPRHFVLGERVAGFSAPEAMTPRMTHMPGTKGTVCPYSGIVGDDDAFTHPDDQKAALKTVEHAAAEDVAEAFHEMFRDLGRKFSGSKFIQVKPGPRPTRRPKPRFVRKDLLRVMACDECGRDYGVFAISLFCPDCGAPNIHLHFAREVSLVRQQVEVVEKLPPEQGELAYRLLGNAHEDVLTAFEATLKTAYLHKVAGRLPGEPEIKPPGNAFQNIERAQKRFAEFSFDPFDKLDAATLAVLVLNIQKRHVIGHNLGIADATFAEHAVDARLGETIPLVAKDILKFGEICQLVVDRVDGWLAGGTAPSTSATPPLPTATSTASPEGGPTEPQIGELSSLAMRIGKWIAAKSQQGLTRPVNRDALFEAFKEEPLPEVLVAVAELEKDGYVTTSSTINTPLLRVVPTVDLFVDFDPIVLQTDPVADAADLIDLILAGQDSVSVSDLHSKIGWPLRRFNPPAALVISYIDHQRVSGEFGGDLPARQFFMMAGDRVELKRYLSRLRA